MKWIFNRCTSSIIHVWNHLRWFIPSVIPFCHSQFFGLSNVLNVNTAFWTKIPPKVYDIHQRRHLSNKNNNKPVTFHYYSCWSECKKEAYNILMNIWCIDLGVVKYGNTGQIVSFQILKNLKHNYHHGMYLSSLPIPSAVPQKATPEDQFRHGTGIYSGKRDLTEIPPCFCSNRNCSRGRPNSMCQRTEIILQRDGRRMYLGRLELGKTRGWNLMGIPRRLK